MYRKAILGLTALLMTIAVASTTVNADEVSVVGLWNHYASQYNFAGYPGPGWADFEDAYRGNNFESDLGGMFDTMAVIIEPIAGDDTFAVIIEPIAGDDTFNATLSGLDAEF